MTHRRKPMGTCSPNFPGKDGIRPWTKAYWKTMMEYDPSFKPDPEDVKQRHLTPEMLWKLACLYFRDAHNDTIIKRDYIRSGEKAGQVVEIKVQRPFSHCGLEMFIEAHGIVARISDFRTNKDGKYPEFRDVTERIDAIIRQDKFDGAAVGNYNAALITRDLGLAENLQAQVAVEQPLFTDLPQAPIEK